MSHPSRTVLDGCYRSMTPTPYLLPVELIYRELARPKPQEAKPVSVEAPPAIELTRTDVTAIIHRKLSATPEELQEIIARAKDYKLTDGERNQIACDLTIAMSQRARQVSGRREDPSARFIHDTLGLTVTPYGLIEREWYESQLKAGAEAIKHCRNHRPPRCPCWSEARQLIFDAQSVYDLKSPQGWAVTKVYEILDELEVASRPDSGPSVA
jgi:hypothetical protein